MDSHTSQKASNLAPTLKILLSWLLSFPHLYTIGSWTRYMD